MLINFQDHFWGEKLNGFAVLQENFKHGFNSSKEFADFLKERSSIEEAYSKSLLKLANKCTAASQHVGSFEPCWKFLQSCTEKQANVHSQIIQNLNDVSCTVKEYSDQQREKQKQMKDDFTATADAVTNLQTLSTSLTKAKELYEQRSQEVEKSRKDFSSLKEIKSAEVKFKKSNDEYKLLVDKRENARLNFQEKMCEISQKLQTVEEHHLQQMLEILNKYGETLKVESILLNQIIEEFERSMLALTIETLLQQFIGMKKTGKSMPPPVDYVEVEMKSKPIDIDAISQAIKEEKKKRKSEKKEKKNERKKKKDKSSANGNVEKTTEGDSTSVHETTLNVDSEGYVIKPVDTMSISSAKSRDSFSSGSESNSDDERQKIQVHIKPVEETVERSLSEDQLKKLGAAITLVKPKRKISSTSCGEEKKFALLFSSHNNLNTLTTKSLSNNDLLNLAQERGPDTASLHSLPNDSSFHHSTDFSLKQTPSITSPNSDVNDVTSLDSMSPFESFNHADDSKSSLGETPPNRSFSNSAMFYQDQDDEPPNLLFRSLNASATNNIKRDNDATNKFVTNFDILKPPASERRHTSMASFLPRPKTSQQQLIPAAPAVAENVVASKSSLSDLLDINFSADAPVNQNEKMSQWVSVEENSDVTSPALPRKNHSLSTTDSPVLSVFPLPLHPVTTMLPTTLPPPATLTTTTTLPLPTISYPSATSQPPLVITPQPMTLSPSLTSATGDLQASIISHNSSSGSGDFEQVIPIAVAFMETVNGFFKAGDDSCSAVKVTGDMTISFPASVVNKLITNPSPPILSFLVKGTSSLEQIFPNKALVEREGQLAGCEGITFKFKMGALSAYLKKQVEQGGKALYYNIDILKYQVRCHGVNSSPLQLSAYWRCDDKLTDLKIEYKANSTCMSNPVSLSNVTVLVPVNGDVSIMQSKPTAVWSNEHQRCMWKFPVLESDAVNALRARFDVASGPSTPAPVSVQFTGEGSTISLLDLHLTSVAYKLSLVKKRFSSGKYIAE